jgi:hypothetical protein
MNSEQKNPTGVENAPEQGEKTGEKTVKVTVEISRQANDLLNYYAKSIKINKGELADNILLDKLLTKSDDFLYCKKCNKPVLYLISFPIISGKGEIICKSCGEKNEFER